MLLGILTLVVVDGGGRSLGRGLFAKVGVMGEVG